MRKRVRVWDMIELLHTFIKYTVVYKQEEKKWSDNSNYDSHSLLSFWRGGGDYEKRLK